MLQKTKYNIILTCTYLEPAKKRKTWKREEKLIRKLEKIKDDKKQLDTYLIRLPSREQRQQEPVKEEKLIKTCYRKPNTVKTITYLPHKTSKQGAEMEPKQRKQKKQIEKS